MDNYSVINEYNGKDIIEKEYWVLFTIAFFAFSFFGFTGFLLFYHSMLILTG